MESPHCKNCSDIAKKNIELEIKIQKLESKIQYYENAHSPPSSDSLQWRKEKKNRKSKNPSKPGQKNGHQGIAHNLKPTKKIHHYSIKFSNCGGS